MELGLILIFLLPIIVLIMSLVISKKVKIAMLALIPNMFLLGFGYFLEKIDSHSNLAKTLTSFKFNGFNIVVILITIISSVLIYIFAKKYTNSKTRAVINTLLYTVIFIIEFILIKMYFSCQ